MNIFQRIAEEKIEAAIREGAFDALPGKGKPLKLDENPDEDPAWRLAHHLLRSQGFTLPWIEMRAQIQADIDRLRRDRAAHAAAETAVSGADPTRLDAHFRDRIEALNRRIFVYNLHAPSPSFHLMSWGFYPRDNSQDYPDDYPRD